MRACALLLLLLACQCCSRRLHSAVARVHEGSTDLGQQTEQGRSDNVTDEVSSALHSSRPSAKEGTLLPSLYKVLTMILLVSAGQASGFSTGGMAPGLALRGPTRLGPAISQGLRRGSPVNMYDVDPVDTLGKHASEISRFPEGTLHWEGRAFNAPISSIGSQIAPLVDVVGKIEDFLPNLFRKEPDWSVFAQNFQVIDHDGVAFEGLESTKVLLDHFRRMHKIVDAKPVEMNFFNKRYPQDPVDPFLVANFKLQLIGSSPNRFWLWKKKTPIDIEAEAVFHFNEMNQVDYVRIDKWFINGRECSIWPVMSIFDDSRTNVRKIEQWAHDINELHNKFDAIENLTAAERAAFFAEARHHKASREAELGFLSEDVNVIDFGSGYTRANLVKLGLSGSASSERVKGLRSIPLQDAVRDPDLIDGLVNEIAEALPSGRILAGATAGVRYALEKGTITEEQVVDFERAFSQKLGDRAQFNVLTRREEAEAEWRSVKLALQSLEDMGAPGVPKLEDVHGMLSSGGVSCQIACRNGADEPELFSFDNLIGDGFFEYDDLKGPSGKEFAKILPALENRIQKNVKETRIRGLKGTYVLTELWKALSFDSNGDAYGIMPYETVPLSDVLSAIDLRLQDTLSSDDPLTRSQAKVILVSTLGRVVFREMFDPSAQICFMGGDDMNWSIGWAEKEEPLSDGNLTYPR